MCVCEWERGREGERETNGVGVQDVEQLPLEVCQGRLAVRRLLDITCLPQRFPNQVEETTAKSQPYEGLLIIGKTEIRFSRWVGVDGLSYVTHL